MKKHWTQTAAGKKRMNEIMKQRWAKRRLDREISGPQSTAMLSEAITNLRIQRANTVAELEEIKAFLDLRDELLARLP